MKGPIAKGPGASETCIRLRGVEVHNLQGVDLDIPRGQLTVLCGVSGSGKTSLALDTLYAEGQRRYIESFSAYTRQFLERLEKPDCERIDGMPPAIAVTHKNTSRSSRTTVGTSTETNDHLRLLLARIGRTSCYRCGHEVRRMTPQSIAAVLEGLPEGTRYQIAFPAPLGEGEEFAPLAARLREEGYVRAVVGGRTLELDDPALSGVTGVASGSNASSGGSNVSGAGTANGNGVYVVVDRLRSGGTSAERLRDSLEGALAGGEGTCFALVPADANGEGEVAADGGTEAATAGNGRPGGVPLEIDGRTWQRLSFTTDLRCEDCQLDYPVPEPRLFSFNSPLGACPECEGFGNVIDIDMDLVVPDPSRTLREGAIAPWNTPAYAHELEELTALADDYDIPLDVPFAALEEKHLEVIRAGVPEREFGGLNGFFAWLERRKYKMHLRVFLSRWRSYSRCPVCNGARLRPEALATQVGGRNMAELCGMKVRELRPFFAALELSEWEQRVGRMMLDQIDARLQYLDEVGLGYLELDRTLRTLSGGEAQRVALTSALGSSLVNMLYVLDEPSVGLHPSDVDRLVRCVTDLRDRGNTVVVVEHEESLIRAADHVVEIGPGAGEQGGRIVFEGTPDEMEACRESLTGDYLSGRRGSSPPGERRACERGWIRLAGAAGNNLQDVTVELPLGVLCLVTGVSGAGKSTLIQDTLYPALCRRMRKDGPKPLPYDDVLGDGQIDEVLLVDQSAIGRSPRSNPVTYIKAFDEIRKVFAGTVEARTHNFTAGHFSFNTGRGRCEQCEGDGYQQIDMQFLADVFMKCPECQGKRYRREILEVTYRGRSIADVLEMTIREAFTFFRGHTKVQARLQKLIDVGLDYLRLGQPAGTLSGGEAQRLKLASYMTTGRRGRTLFLLDEPTTGLHFSDVVQLLDCFDSLLAVGHSLIVVEHSLQVMKAADWIVDLGPGAADQGGRIVAKGTPEEVAKVKKSVTGKWMGDRMKDEG